MNHEELTNSWTGIVDVGSKEAVFREAVATGTLHLSNEGIVAVGGKSPKGDVREISTIASIQAVKDTPRMLPHCHLRPIEGCSVIWNIEGKKLRCTVTVRTHWRTGVEMEALCGVNAGLLCAWDMLKSIEKDDNGQYPNSQIDGVRVVRKSKGDQHH
jgi:cyclic pyranopterin phosphate synthase